MTNIANSATQTFTNNATLIPEDEVAMATKIIVSFCTL
jgi:hypothetical protein